MTLMPAERSAGFHVGREQASRAPLASRRSRAAAASLRGILSRLSAKKSSWLGVLVIAKSAPVPRCQPAFGAGRCRTGTAAAFIRRKRDVNFAQAPGSDSPQFTPLLT